jgi:hypothetical protein
MSTGFVKAGRSMGRGLSGEVQTVATATSTNATGDVGVAMVGSVRPAKPARQTPATTTTRRITTKPPYPATFQPLCWTRVVIHKTQVPSG